MQWRDGDLYDEYGRMHVEIQSLDPELVAISALIMFEAYEKVESPVELPHGSFQEEFIGVLGESVVGEALYRCGIYHHYNGPRRDHWEEAIHRTDFEILPNGPLLEICTTPPSGVKNYVCCTVNEKKLHSDFVWDHAVGVKIVDIKGYGLIPIKEDGEFFWRHCRIDGSQYPDRLFIPIPEETARSIKYQELMGRATIYGYGARTDIEKLESGWNKREPPERKNYPCPDYPCRWKKLENLIPIRDLLEKKILSDSKRRERQPPVTRKPSESKLDRFMTGQI